MLSVFTFAVVNIVVEKPIATRAFTTSTWFSLNFWMSNLWLNGLLQEPRGILYPDFTFYSWPESTCPPNEMSHDYSDMAILWAWIVDKPSDRLDFGCCLGRILLREYLFLVCCHHHDENHCDRHCTGTGAIAVETWTFGLVLISDKWPSLDYHATQLFVSFTL